MRLDADGFWGGALGAMIDVAIVVGTVGGMEALAGLVHRTVMHGWGWGWHRSHHEPRNGVFELNDLYGVTAAVGAMGLMMVGGVWHWPVMWWVGAGMTVYGVLYAVLHDGLVHRRWPFAVTPRHAFVKRLIQAHRMHHAVVGRTGGVSFGFLYAPPVRVLRARLQRQRGVS